MSKQTVALALMSLILAACASTPESTPVNRDSPQPGTGAPVMGAAASAPGGSGSGGGATCNNPLASLNANPDIATPQMKEAQARANLPYLMNGVTYRPGKGSTEERRGTATLYHDKYHGQPLSSGEQYDMYCLTAAHHTLPIPSYARVTNTSSKKTVVVRINDRGPISPGHVLELSQAAAHQLGIIGDGKEEVEIESLGADIGTSPLPAATKVENKPLAANAPGGMPMSSLRAEPSGRSIFLQLGAFNTRKAADRFMVKMRQTLGNTGKQLSVMNKDGLYRVNLGTYESLGEARASADGMKRKLRFKPLLKRY